MNRLLNIFTINLLFLCLIGKSLQGFYDRNEQLYLESFETLIKDSYSENLPLDLINNCKNKPIFQSSLQIKTITSTSITSAKVQEVCSTDSLCVIDTATLVKMNSNLNLAALIIKGKFEWNDQTQSLNEQWLCAGYIGVDKGEFNMNLTKNKGFIYIKNNNVKSDELSYRALGSYNKGKINIIGRTLNRTWSLLSKKIVRSVSSISLMHDPVEMGWRLGDRIVMAPNDLKQGGSQGTSEDFFIGGFQSKNVIQLVDKNGQKANTSKIYYSESKYVSKDMYALNKAEVINLSRNIIITGDDFTHVNGDITTLNVNSNEYDVKQADQCTAQPNIGRTKCTLGLHIMAKNSGAVLSLQYVRIEKCGQRGVLGKYCTHLHLVQRCIDCKIIGNAYEFGMQRGTVIHGTHLALVEQNVYNDIRGALIYIEDGNELYNKIEYNVGICPWAKEGEKHGCTIPGTDNGQADTTLNQAGLWALGFNNHVIGNRFANNYNGMLYQEQGLGGGRSLLRGKMCNNKQKIGRLEGNTFHHCGRFGTYVLADVYPSNVESTIESDGVPVNKNRDCVAWLPDGSDNGKPVMFKNNVDYRVTFVGQYNAGDLQYKNHVSFENGNLIYWKETKNFQDGCSAHLSDSYFEEGNMALPGGHGTFILEDLIFKNKVSFESAHHCNEGPTGVLCMPTYLFVNMSWIGEAKKPSITWHSGKITNNGAMFTLPPDDPLLGNELFPKGFRSIIHPYWEYLLKLDNEKTCFREEQINKSKDNYRFNGKPYGAIFCTKSVRRLEIFSFGNDERSMNLELYQNEMLISSVNLQFYRIGDSKKQGYSATVIPGLTHKYKLKMAIGNENVPIDWIIEFSDSVFGNRWTKDEIKLEVAGRNCPPIINSQHDRRWIWSGNDYLKVTGRGACSENQDMPPLNCKLKPKLSFIEDCPICNGVTCSTGSSCDCGTGKCSKCEPGYSGPNCQNNICSSTNCVNGICALKYLGGNLPATIDKCVCIEGWYGENCDSKIKPMPDLSSLYPCEGYCKGDSGKYSYGCSTGSQFGYCGLNGGCFNTNQKLNNTNMCCFKGCENENELELVTNLPTTIQISTSPASPTSSTTQSSVCDGFCQGNYPYGCSSGFEYGYCNQGGGCNYSPNNFPDFCCFKGCKTKPDLFTSQNPTTISLSTITVQSVTQSSKCDGFCKGSYPYGCNGSFKIGYCNQGGGCNYSPNNFTDFCCFKGC